jgi:hypothetical protein
MGWLVLRFRSKYEQQLYENATKNGQELQFEPFKLPYLTKGNYIPDFVLPNGVIIEAKGYFDVRARAKMKAVRQNNPTLDIRFVFMDSRKKLGKGSKSTYADWCEKNGFMYADGMIPLTWFTK